MVYLYNEFKFKFRTFLNEIVNLDFIKVKKCKKCA